MTDQPAVGGEAMRPLHPDQIWVLRIRALIAGSVAVLAAFLADFGPLRETGLRPGLVPASVLALAAAAILILPRRRYRAWGWREEEDELHIRHGLLVRTRTAVPFARVTHIDLSQGPVQRGFGLATLILHTAGTRGAAVPLPGLEQAEAEALRDRIRARIRLDLA